MGQIGSAKHYVIEIFSGMNILIEFWRHWNRHSLPKTAFASNNQREKTQSKTWCNKQSVQSDGHCREQSVYKKMSLQGTIIEKDVHCKEQPPQRNNHCKGDCKEYWKEYCTLAWFLTLIPAQTVETQQNCCWEFPVFIGGAASPVVCGCMDALDT